VNNLAEKEKHVHGQGRKSVLPETGRKSATPEKTVLLDIADKGEDRKTEIAQKNARGRQKKITKEVVEEEEEEVEDNGEETVGGADADITKESRDSLVSELLSDDSDL
jgi:hypothetical protein